MARRPDWPGDQIGWDARLARLAGRPHGLGGHMGWEATWAGRPHGLGGHMDWEARLARLAEMPDWLGGLLIQ